MDLRNVQKTGNMFYVYLPTKWCKKNNVTTGTKVSLTQNNDGSLTIYPLVLEEEKRTLEIDLSSIKLSPEDINKLIVASYINPVNSFRIKLDYEIKEQLKNKLEIEFIEFDKNMISCENPIYIDEPFTLLKTMIKKIKSLIYIMKNNYNKELVEKYENEIDKSKLLIEKSVIGALTNRKTSKMKPVELHYTAMLSKELERFVDHLKEIKDNEFFRKMESFINEVYEIIEKIETKSADYKLLTKYLNTARKARKKYKVEDYHKIRIMSSIRMISETITDWVITLNV